MSIDSLKNNKFLHPLFWQLLFVVITFILMIAVYRFYISATMRGIYNNGGVETLNQTKLKIQAELLEPETALIIISGNIREMIMRGEDENAVFNYMQHITNEMHDKSNGFKFNGVSGYFEAFGGSYITFDWDIPEDFNPPDRPWYEAGVNSEGEVVITPIYKNLRVMDYIITYVRRIFDNERNPLGMVCLNVHLDVIRNYVAAMTLPKKGYGVLLDDRQYIYYHPNEEFIGRNYHEINSEIVFLSDKMDEVYFYEQEAKNYENKDVIVFSGKLDNGWYILSITPKNEFYRELRSLEFVLLLLGIFMAAVLIIVLIRFDLVKRKKDEENRQAEAASYAKSVFLANMSHEIRTPMNSIMGFAELALDYECPPKIKEYIEKIRKNTEWLLQIVNDILDISKIESGKIELEHIPFNMEELFLSCQTLIAPKAAEKGLILHFYAEPFLNIMPVGDPTRLRQVFLNLLSNAVKFTNNGMIKFIATIKESREKNISMYFEVKDTGIGMESAQIGRISAPFMQAETGTTRKYGGTGLGLPITINIIEMMGGKLSIESSPGLGSKFSFELVFDKKETDSEDVKNNHASDYIDKPVLDGEVLLCEDNVMNQQVICDHLARTGIKTVVAENGKIGVDMIKKRIQRGEKQFDLIFMDMHMPVMDGLEAASKITDLKTGVPIVAMTANIMAGDAENYKNYGMQDCVGKPFTSQELWRCLLKYFTPVEAHEKINMPEKTPSIFDLQFQSGLLKLFRKTNCKKFEEISAALDAGDIKKAHLLVHGLKSNAGQIGMPSLQKAASVIESLLKDGENHVTPEQMLILESELNTVLSQIDNEFPLEEEQSYSLLGQSAGENDLMDGNTAREFIKNLEPMLKMGSSDCLNLIEKIRCLPDIANPQNMFPDHTAGKLTGADIELKTKLIKQIDDFEFNQAIDTLAEIKERLALFHAGNGEYR